MNKVILMGRLTADPEVRQTPNGISFTRFSIAVNRRFAKDGEQNVDFLNCIAWRETGERIAKFFSKGNMIAVVGSIQTRSWDDANGKKQYTTEIVADEWSFTGEKKESTGFAPPPQKASSENDFADISGFDDLPDFMK